MSTATTTNLPKFAKLDATAEDKALVQSLRSRFDVTEKSLISALMLLAKNHDAELLKVCTALQEAQANLKKAAKAAKP